MASHPIPRPSAVAAPARTGSDAAGAVAATTRDPASRRRGRRATVLALVGVLSLAALASLLSFSRVHRYFLERAVDTGRATLQLVADGVDATLRKYEPLPALVAERPILLDVLRDPDNAGLLPFANEQLRQSARTLHGARIYLLDRDGRVLIASDYREPDSVVGRRFAHHADFAAAVEGRLGRFHGVGEVGGRRGFQFAAPVLDGVRVAGVLAVRVDVDELERSWRLDEREIVLLDPDGIVFLASRADWRLRSMTPLTPAVRARIEAARQYPPERLVPLEASAHPLESDSARLRFAAASDDASYLASSLPLAAPGWHAVSLTPERPIYAQSAKALALWSLVLVTGLLAALVVVQGRARARERLVWHRAQRRQLEREVRARTVDLDASNAALTLEVEERRQTETRLRRTQRELVQAGKLAALGRMSAALAHEINQPLAAVKTYARNAMTLVERERPDDVRDNLARISDMVDRIAQLSSHLRSFARRPQDSLGPIDVGAVIDDAIALMAPEAKKLGATIRHAPTDGLPHALGGRLRLQQVVVNLLSNALDAMRDRDGPVVHVRAEATEEGVDVVVRDTGPGLGDAAIEQAFEPFFTTKAPGEGLGLGLSISFNIVEDFGGRLSAANRPEGGAEFRVRLRRADAPDRPETTADVERSARSDTDRPTDVAARAGTAAGPSR